MKTITVHASHTYDVLIGRGLLSEVGTRSAALGGGRNAAIVSDSEVAPLYLETVRRSLESAGFSVVTEQIIPAGEQSKNFTRLGELLEAFAASHLTRSDTVFALGGGVVGDLAGFAAAIYLRGVRCVQIPTSLLAMVDSSVGGKTAVDLQAGKNLAGAFLQPAAVFCDSDVLDTLPEAFLTDGSAEVAKYAILMGDPLLSLLKDGVKAHLEDVLSLCIDCKRALVEEDEFDRGSRMLLNLGHTVGHAIERRSAFEIPHGRAVAMGCAAAADLALRLGVCAPELPEQVRGLLRTLGLPTEVPYPADELCGAMLSDKKRDGDTIRFVLPVRMGECIPYAIGVGEFPALLREVLS